MNRRAYEYLLITPLTSPSTFLLPTTIAELRTTLGTRHMQTALIPHDHVRASRTTLPSLLISQFLDFLSVFVSTTDFPRVCSGATVAAG